MAITDDFYSSGTQPCNFGSSTSMGYDDLGRLLMDDCGSGGWGQTFTYDPYNNLTKAIISGRTGTTFNPTYNTASDCSPCNNHYRTGYTATYDSDGNQLYDPSNMDTYNWNEFSKMASIDKSGTCVTYDAFGRDVEIDSGTTYTEIFYTQVGKALQHGTTEVYSYWGLPGGGTQVFSGSTGYLHKDWLGSARLMSNIAAQSITYDQALTPYGEQYARSGSVGTEAMFTGDTQDISSGTSGLWDTPSRELGTAPSRWLSPDPAQLGWNPYAYATNPNSFSDPSGLACSAIAGPVGGFHPATDCPTPCQVTIDGGCAGGEGSGNGGDGGGGGGVLGSGESTVSCPNNVCDGFTNDGQYLQFVAGAGGAQGYVLFSEIVQGLYEVNGTFMSSAQYNSYVQSTFASQIDAQRQALAQAIAANSGGTISYQDAYDSLSVEGGHLQGGNYNFVETTYDAGDLTCDSDRCNGVHFPDPGFVHLDTTNPFAGDAGSFFAHGFVDLFLGNFFYTVIPRPGP